VKLIRLIQFLAILAVVSISSVQAAGLIQDSLGEGRSPQKENGSIWAGWVRPSTGVYNISKDENRAANFSLEYFFKYKLWVFQPFFGLQYTSTADFYGYLGTSVDFYFTRNFYLAPSFALGYYKHTRGVDLGFPLEFREGIEVGWHFENEIRLGLMFFHMSNSQLGPTNPGQETLGLVVSIPIWFHRPGSRKPASAGPAPSECACAVAPAPKSSAIIPEERPRRDPSNEF
jgi:hypothetical protein